MILGFKRRFEPMVVSGKKRHTIRADSGRRWRAGMTADCFIDSRQKTMRCIGRWPVVKVESIRIQAAAHCLDLDVWIDGFALPTDELVSFAQRDGFQDTTDMARFWEAEHKLTLGGPSFYGVVIHWDFDHPLPIGKTVAA